MRFINQGLKQPDVQPNAVIYLLIFCSGFSGLMYEIAWIRQASLTFGSSALALSTVLAIFFFGLGSGSYLFGRLAMRTPRPLFWCAALELLLAANGLFSQFIFAGAETLFGEIYRAFSPTSGQILLIRASLLAAILLPPTLLMGGTLPLFCRQLIRIDSRIAGQLGLIYGCNTLGAAFGCLGTGFWLLPQLGLAHSLQLAATLNVLVGLSFLTLRLPEQQAIPVQTSYEPAAIDSPRLSMLLPASLFFIIGAVALANELIWTRFLSHFIRNSIYTYSIALCLVLLGGAAGSLWLGKRFDRQTSLWQLLLYFALLQATSALSVQLLTHLPASFWHGLQATAALTFAVSMLPAAVIAGACFPLLNRMVVQYSQHAPKRIGAMSAINIAGCIAGSLLAGYWLLPSFGLDLSISLTTACSMLAALLATIAGVRLKAPDQPHAAITATLGLLLTCWCLLLMFPPLSIPKDLMSPDEVLLDYAEGYNSSLAVTQREQEKTLLIDGLWQGVGQRNYQVMVAHVPMLHYPEAEKVLVIGLGAGTTASRFLDYDIRQLDIIDIEPRLFDFTRKHFASGWMDDARVHLLPEDGRNFVKHTAQQYDLISVEIGQLNRPGVGVFYTRDFYREARARLRSGGMISQFVPLRFLRPGEFAAILKTFIGEFPSARLWYNTDELLLLGFKDQPHLLSQAKFMATTSAKPSIKADINMYFWGGARFNLRDFPIFLAGFLASGSELQQLAEIAPGPIYNDDQLQLSYSVSDYQASDRRAKDIVPYLQQHLSPISAAVDLASTDPRSLEIATSVRPYNVGDIVASDIVSIVNRSTDVSLNRAELMKQTAEALRWNPLNIYAQAFRQQTSDDAQKK